jgi:hypothetical protein
MSDHLLLRATLLTYQTSLDSRDYEVGAGEAGEGLFPRLETIHCSVGLTTTDGVKADWTGWQNHQAFS